MSAFEVILIMVELLLSVAVILVMLLLFMLLNEFLRPSKPKKTKAEEVSENGSMQAIHPERRP